MGGLVLGVGTGKHVGRQIRVLGRGRSQRELDDLVISGLGVLAIRNLRTGPGEGEVLLGAVGRGRHGVERAGDRALDGKLGSIEHIIVHLDAGNGELHGVIQGINSGLELLIVLDTALEGKGHGHAAPVRGGLDLRHREGIGEPGRNDRLGREVLRKRQTLRHREGGGERGGQLRERDGREVRRIAELSLDGLHLLLDRLGVNGAGEVHRAARIDASGSAVGGVRSRLLLLLGRGAIRLHVDEHIGRNISLVSLLHEDGLLDGRIVLGADILASRDLCTLPGEVEAERLFTRARNRVEGTIDRTGDGELLAVRDLALVQAEPRNGQRDRIGDGAGSITRARAEDSGLELFIRGVGLLESEGDRDLLAPHLGALDLEEVAEARGLDLRFVELRWGIDTLGKREHSLEEGCRAREGNIGGINARELRLDVAHLLLDGRNVHRARQTEGLAVGSPLTEQRGAVVLTELRRTPEIGEHGAFVIERLDLVVVLPREVISGIGGESGVLAGHGQQTKELIVIKAKTTSTQGGRGAPVFIGVEHKSRLRCSGRLRRDLPACEVAEQLGELLVVGGTGLDHSHLAAAHGILLDGEDIRIGLEDTGGPEGAAVGREGHAIGVGVVLSIEIELRHAVLERKGRAGGHSVAGAIGRSGPLGELLAGDVEVLVGLRDVLEGEHGGAILIGLDALDEARPRTVVVDDRLGVPFGIDLGVRAEHGVRVIKLVLDTGGVLVEPPEEGDALAVCGRSEGGGGIVALDIGELVAANR